MKNISSLFLFSFLVSTITAQTFVRSELPTDLDTPWEMTYGPDNYLWITEAGGIVSRVDPLTGDKQVVYTADDYFDGSPLEQSELCFQPEIGHGTLGLALHPDFGLPAYTFIYYVYSYNQGTEEAPMTRFKLVRLNWDPLINEVVDHIDLVTDLPTGYDHLGGRLIAVKRGGEPYLFLTLGDNGISETNSPDCYNPQSENPNNFAQDPYTKNGKIHRFNMFGGIPEDNPLPDSSFFSRGHRNPQGLMYNAEQDVLYDIEHGDRTDDEINIILPGKNYGWKDVRGYHSDNNFPGEAAYVAGYEPHPDVAGDMLMEPLYSWCATTPSKSDDFLDWCTVAPSDGIYYASTTIPEWTNSLLVVTLKNGAVTDNEVFMFKLTANGQALQPSTEENPNPKQYFAEDQAQNGRLRDIAVSADGAQIFLINNNTDMDEKIVVYTYQAAVGVAESANDPAIRFYPNPADDNVQIVSPESKMRVEMYNTAGDVVKSYAGNISQLDISDLSAGMYTIHIVTANGHTSTGRMIKR